MVLRKPPMSLNEPSKASTAGCVDAPNEHPIQLRNARRPWARASGGMFRASEPQRNFASTVAEFDISRLALLLSDRERTRRRFTPAAREPRLRARARSIFPARTAQA